MSEQKKSTKVVKPTKNLITQDDITWVSTSQSININKISGDERLSSKAAHISRKFKQSMIYNHRRNNKNTHIEHYKEELDFHASRHGWWEMDYDNPL